MVEPPDYYVARLLSLQSRLVGAVVGRRSSPDCQDTDVVREGDVHGAYTGDIIYRIDEQSEQILLEFCEEWAGHLDRPFVLIAEGLSGNGRHVFPSGADPADATFECVVDPIDGTRGLMYGKRSAWALAAVAPGQAVLGRPATLSDIVMATQAELPTERARLADILWAVRGQGAQRRTRDLVSNQECPAPLSPSRSHHLAHGFATISKFFPGTKALASQLEEQLFAALVGEHASGAPLIFDDEYISSGGQLYELMVGHDRFIADLRPGLLDAIAAQSGGQGAAGHARRLCARPYDLCTALIAQEAGVIVTDMWGAPLSAPLDTVSDVSWIGYANEALQRSIEPVLQRLLREIGVPG